LKQFLCLIAYIRTIFQAQHYDLDHKSSAKFPLIYLWNLKSLAKKL
jgi:hypothetical protein